MAQNLAQAQPYSTPQRAQPKQIETVTPQAAPKRLPISGFEILLGAICGIVIVCFAVNIIHSRIDITNAQRNLQTTQVQLSHVNNENAAATQEISELTSRTRLDTVAKKNGLTLTSQNIRNVSK
ncbi:cell division protein FtsL [Furfurilactobacillus siliginis]|uniref:Cell division protein FtsL n=1 Tax=Furfurilactobacillus siliginis TaxID=348151 RepID=A0A0R2L3F3_9LACO|nr:cell division protein FtsL [Furfurilactobacillus siliginis]KRN96113.1 hypothetical protein IV55_GL001496 [Furfurilactobacillus siliginis]GEK27963.1 hypothetical protein LSI01_02740 [Furfurilactobacillus siliginis]